MNDHEEAWAIYRNLREAIERNDTQWLFDHVQEIVDYIELGLPVYRELTEYRSQDRV